MFQPTEAFESLKSSLDVWSILCKLTSDWEGTAKRWAEWIETSELNTTSHPLSFPFSLKISHEGCDSADRLYMLPRENIFVLIVYGLSTSAELKIDTTGIDTVSKMGVH